MKNIITFLKEHKNKIITVVAIVVILTGAFWYGTGSIESRGFSVKSGTVEATQSGQNIEDATKKSTTIDGDKNSQEHDENTASTDSLENDSKEQGSTNVDEKADSKNDANGSESGNNYTTQESSQETTEAAQSGNQSDDAGEVVKNTFSVTLSISCANVLNHMDQLKANKKDIIPADGWILKTNSVQMTEGETVYDALVRACKENGILTDAEYTPFYGTYYLKGIQNLYQMDCGDESGWMYKINGDVAKVGASTYKVKAGDNIQWLYTCVKGDIS